mmetsp:Transcript_20593/g.34126  ORF Transcript_20593/g.34126 Transcript_20593/m.34126 type:complete len:224 (-) Transcript_20593:47-718(-)
MFGGDELEVDGVYNRPDLPRSLASREEVVLDFVSNGREGISVDKSKVGEEDSHKDWAPKDLVNSDLEGDVLGISSGDFVVEPVVEVVTRRTVVKETEGRKREETLHVEGALGDENLSEEISKSPSNKGGHCLGGQWVLVELIVVSCPSWDSASSGDGGVTEQRTVKSSVLAERGGTSTRSRLGNVLGNRGDSERRSGKAGGGNNETEELHFDYLYKVLYLRQD